MSRRIPCVSIAMSMAILGGVAGAARLRAADCNGNGRSDAADLRSGSSADLNENGVPDECETWPVAFKPAATLETRTPARAFVTGDFNGDGRVDALIASAEAGGEPPAVTLFAQDADGLFAPGAEPGRQLISRIQSGDVDGDGDLDIVAADTSSLWVVWNTSEGGFSHATRLCESNGLAALVAADLNGDGRADVIAAFRPNDELKLFLGAGSERVLEPRALKGGPSPASLAAGDFDGDGDLDVAVGSLNPGGVVGLLNAGDSGFSETRAIEKPESPREFLIASDWNQDGKTDLAALSRFGLAILKARQDGTFEEPAPFAVAKDGLPLRAVAAGDVDADGDTDLALGLSSAPGVLFVLNRSDGVFNASTRMELEAPPSAIALADLDSDGAPELLLTLFGSQEISIRKSSADDPPSALPAGLELQETTISVGFEPHSCSLADFDRDGAIDMAVIDGETNANFLRNPGDGMLRFQKTVRVRDSLEMISLMTQDLDGDGDADVALSDEATNNVLVLMNQGNWSFKQTGSYSVGERPTQVVAGDLTGDGVKDLLSVDNGNNTLSLLKGKGSGVFASASATPTRSHPMAVAAGDFRGTGQLDVALASYGTSEVIILENDGKGRLRSTASHPVRWPTFVVAADFDSDGRVDVAASSYGTQQVVLLWNQGKSFQAGRPLGVGQAPFTAITPDLNGDKLPDLVTSNTMSGTITVFLNLGNREFAEGVTLQVGADPRFAVAGDLDADGDIDLVSANHSSLDLTLLFNNSRKKESPKQYLRQLVTEGDFHQISMRAGDRGRGRALRQTKFVIPRNTADSSLLEPVFQDVKVQPLHQLFLAEAFPEKFPALSADVYDALTGRRATRKYWSGVLSRLRGQRGPIYGFTLLADFADDPRELPTPAEAREAFETLSKVVHVGPLAYAPDPGLAAEDAATWREPGLPIYIERKETPRPRAQVGRSEEPSKAEFELYTQGVGFGRVRILTQAAFQDLNTRGGLSYQDVLVLERAPRDIEGVVAGVITAEKQGELSHLALRTARRGTPNAYLGGALESLRRLDGLLVRIEVDDGGPRVSEAVASEAAEWWGAHRPRLSPFPEPDLRYGSLDALDEIPIAGETPPETRFGGKASNFARLASILEGPFARYREVGFGIPLRYYSEFLAAARVASARNPAREVTGAEFLDEISAWQEFQSDSRLRFEALARFRTDLETRGEVDPDLVARLARRIREVFGRTDANVRFRSSSNVEDALEFNGAGLYESTSACAADDMDGDDEGPSLCDSTKPAERGIAKALKHVWASLWSFRAYEERAYFGIPQRSCFMGILVSPAFQKELANGVAMTGNPQSAEDPRYLVTAQANEESVVSPESGALPERDLLEISNGGVTGITRAQASTLVPAGARVLEDRHLEELGALLAHIDRHLPVDLGGRTRRDILLDVEFKLSADGCVAVKQVRPFLLQDAAPPAPAITVVIPEGTQACGTFVASRPPERAWELKSRVRFKPASFQIFVREEPEPIDWIESVLLGPDEKPLQSKSAGSIVSEQRPEDGAGVYRLRFAQSFESEDGRQLELELHIEVDPESAGSGGARIVMDDEYLTRRLALQAKVGAVVTYSSCGHELLPLWEITAELEGGVSLALLERHQPPKTLNETGPASLVRAEVTWPGGARIVEGYSRLLYTALRHNRAIRYWIALEPPSDLGQSCEPGFGLELTAPEPRLGVEGSARVLDRRSSRSTPMRLLSFQRRAASGDAVARTIPPLRGDANGDGRVGIDDSLAILGATVFCDESLACVPAADADGDGEITPLDSAFIVEWVFGLPRPVRGVPGERCSR